LRSVVASRKAAAEAYQRPFHIVKQTRPRSCAGVLAGYENIVGAGNAQQRQKSAGRLAEAAARPVPDDRSADLLGGGEPFPDCLSRQVPAASLNDKQTASLRITLGYVKEFSPNA